MKVIVAVKTKKTKRWQLGFVVVNDTSKSELMARLKEKWPDIEDVRVIEAILEDPIDV